MTRSHVGVCYVHALNDSIDDGIKGLRNKTKRWDLYMWLVNTCIHWWLQSTQLPSILLINVLGPFKYSRLKFIWSIVYINLKLHCFCMINRYMICIIHSILTQLVLNLMQGLLQGLLDGYIVNLERHDIPQTGHYFYKRVHMSIMTLSSHIFWVLEERRRYAKVTSVGFTASIHV